MKKILSLVLLIFTSTCTTHMEEKFITSGEVILCTESFGKRENPAVLLIMGATASMLWWETDFCRQLADQGFFVIRYDNRDVGRSTTYAPQTIQYNLLDMVDDALRVLDGYQIQQAHLVGMSLGGMISQIAALRSPERVRSITCLASGVFDEDPSLPPMDPRIPEFQARAFGEVDWNDKQSVAGYMVSGARLLNGSKHPFLEDRAFALAHAEISRATNLLSMFNHALLQGGDEYLGKTGEITVPVLIIHGTEDRVLPYPHALAIQKALPQATLVPLEGVGHELHMYEWNTVIDALTEHFRQTANSGNRSGINK